MPRRSRAPSIRNTASTLASASVTAIVEGRPAARAAAAACSTIRRASSAVSEEVAEAAAPETATGDALPPPQLGSIITATRTTPKAAVLWLWSRIEGPPEPEGRGVRTVRTLERPWAAIKLE